MPSDGAGLRALGTTFATAGLLAGATYALPALHHARPWLPGEPLPLVRALVPTTEARVVEDARGDLVPVLEDPPQGTAAAAGAGVDLAAGAAERGLPPRPPGVATPIRDPGHRGMEPFFRALASGNGVARAAHYGDSTIAADGISGTVRERLQARFGDGGLGFMAVGLDARWSSRPGVGVSREGTWTTVTLLNGGGGGRYGFGGVATTGEDGARVSFQPAKRTDGSRPTYTHLEAWYARAPDGGSWWATADGKSVGHGSGVAEKAVEATFQVDVPAGFSRVTLGVTGGPVTFYGMVMENAGPGVAWDALGVVGVGSKSFTQYNRRHLARQVARRAPDLVVLMLGGNELAYPVLDKADGSEYAPIFEETLGIIRAGAPGAGCLLVSPVDQGSRVGSAIETKRGLPRLVAWQQAVADRWGCATWNTPAAMGGPGAIGRWSKLRPPLAWTDLVHLSADGQALVGNLLSDAIESAYDTWLSGGGLSRPPAAAPGPPAAAAPAEGAK